MPLVMTVVEYVKELEMMGYWCLNYLFILDVFRIGVPLLVFMDRTGMIYGELPLDNPCKHVTPNESGFSIQTCQLPDGGFFKGCVCNIGFLVHNSSHTNINSTECRLWSKCKDHQCVIKNGTACSDTVCGNCAVSFQTTTLPYQADIRTSLTTATTSSVPNPGLITIFIVLGLSILGLVIAGLVMAGRCRKKRSSQRPLLNGQGLEMRPLNIEAEPLGNGDDGSDSTNETSCFLLSSCHQANTTMGCTGRMPSQETCSWSTTLEAIQMELAHGNGAACLNFENMCALLRAFGFRHAVEDYYRRHDDTNYVIQDGFSRLMKLGKAKYNPKVLRDKLKELDLCLFADKVEDVCQEKGYPL